MVEANVCQLNLPETRFIIHPAMGNPELGGLMLLLWSWFWVVAVNFACIIPLVVYYNSFDAEALIYQKPDSL